jgi:hypothetical protein
VCAPWSKSGINVGGGGGGSGGGGGGGGGGSSNDTSKTAAVKEHGTEVSVSNTDLP